MSCHVRYVWDTSYTPKYAITHQNRYHVRVAVSYPCLVTSVSVQHIWASIIDRLATHIHQLQPVGPEANFLSRPVFHFFLLLPSMKTNEASDLKCLDWKKWMLTWGWNYSVTLSYGVISWHRFILFINADDDTYLPWEGGLAIFQEEVGSK